MFSENTLAKAEKYLLRNKNEKAIVYLLKAAAENPTNINILNTLAEVYTKVGNTHAACEYYLLVAREYERLNEVAKAIGAYRRFHNLRPDDFEVCMTLARLQMFDRNYAQAEYFLKLCADDFLLRSKLTARDEDIALKLVRMLHTISGVAPSSIEKLRYQSLLYRKIGRDRLASELDLRIGLIYAREGKVGPALEMLRPLPALFPGHLELIQTLTDLLADHGLMAEAAKCIDSCLLVSPNNIQILLLKAKLLTRFAQFEQAEELYHKAVFSDPSYYKEILDFAYRLIDAGHHDRAIKQVDYINSDMTFLQKMEVIAFCKTLLDRDPENVTAMTKLAYFYGEMNDIYQLSSVYVVLFRTYIQQQLYERAHHIGKLLLDLGYRETKFLAAYEDNKARLKPHANADGSGAHQAYKGEDLVKVDTSKVRLWPYYQVETQEVEARALPEKKEEILDVLLNIELLLKYGAKDRALEMINKSLQKYGDNAALREKLRSYYLSKSQNSQAAFECLRLSQMVRARGDLERSQEYLNQARVLDAELAAVVEPSGRPEDTADSGIVPMFTGDLRMFTLIDVIQLITSSNKTGTLCVINGDASGLIRFNGGRLIASEYNGLTGEDAVYGLLQFSEGVFEFRPSANRFPEKIRISTTNLLLEGLRRLDESRRSISAGESEYSPEAVRESSHST